MRITALLLSAVLTATLFASVFFVNISSSLGEYDPRYDWDMSGKIDPADFAYFASIYGTRSTNMSVIVNGEFETGTLAGWWAYPDVPNSAQINDMIVHNGSYSARISDEIFFYNWLHQDIYARIHMPVDSGIDFEGWVYPSKVGLLAGQYPFSAIRLMFYNESSMLEEFRILYTWCMSSTYFNSSIQIVFFLPSWQSSQWNHLSRNVTSDIYAYFGTMDFSNVVLYSVQAVFHYSGTSPGSFYVDDLKISID